MTFGVPKEVKVGETRVSMTPTICRRIVSVGNKVVVEKSAGVRAGFSDAEYRSAGATLLSTAKRVYDRADLILKVKEPLESEFDLMRDGQAVFTYLHLAANLNLARCLVKKNILGIAYETVESQDGSLPLLKPMSQIAGRLAVQIGAYFLQSQHGGSGVLLGGVPGTASGRVTILGAGNSGAHACRIAVGMGAQVTLLDIAARKLEYLDSEYQGRVVTLMANPANIEKSVAEADLLVGAVLIPAAKAPVIVTRNMVRTMSPGSVIVDIAVDQGGCIETVSPTSLTKPTYKRSSVVHYAVPNMPALVGRTSTIALTQATEPFVIAIAEKGLKRALEEVRGLAKGVNTMAGRPVHPQVSRLLKR
ncbi:MAG: alanine dehydrogenase [Verrucomicrobia bacterium]|nr:MAG: alanine dehydrogenase [Verrucomicrobiota bacterium]